MQTTSLLLIISLSIGFCLCRHRPDIFKDDLTFSVAVKQADECYSVKALLNDTSNGSIMDAFKKVIDDVKNVIKLIDGTKELNLCWKPKAVSLDEILFTKIKDLRAKCPESFETAVKNITIHLVNENKKKLKTEISEKVANDYEKAANAQESLTSFLPFLPPMTVFQFSMILVSLAAIVALLIVMFVCCRK